MNLIPVEKDIEENVLFWIHMISVTYILCTNSLLLVALCRVAGLFVAVHTLHITMCLIDMTVGLLVALNYLIPSLDAVKALDRETCGIVKKTWITISRTLFVVEPLFFLMIVIARYCIVTRHLTPATKNFLNTKKFVAILVISSFSVCLLFAFANIYLVKNILDTIIITSFYFGLMLFSLFSMIILNLLMLRFLKKHEMLSNGAVPRSRHQREATCTLLTISIVATITTLPLATLQFMIIAQTLIGDKIEAQINLVRYTKWLSLTFLLNMGFNAHIYVMRNREIKTFFRNNFSVFLSKNDAEENSTTISNLNATNKNKNVSSDVSSQSFTDMSKV